LPLITTIHFPVHPSLHYWPELYPGAALFTKNNIDILYDKVNYASALPSDEELFYSIAEYADDELAGTLKPKYNPLEIRNLLHDLAADIRANLAKAGCTRDSTGERLALWVDFSMIALIAEFHSWKSAAAYYLYLFQKNGTREKLTRSYEAMLNARLKWEELSVLGSRYYHEDLQFNAGTGMARNRNWQYRLETEVNRDIEDLELLLVEAGESPEEFRRNLSCEFYPIVKKSALNLRGEAPVVWNKNEDLILRAWIENGEEPASVFLNYRHTAHTEGDYIQVPMKRSGTSYEALIPGDYFVQGYDVIVYFSALDKKGLPAIFPGINNAEYHAPYFVIKGANRIA
jgi:hypothetical protein